jgi:hypothetical protein
MRAVLVNAAQTFNFVGGRKAGCNDWGVSTRAAARRWNRLMTVILSLASLVSGSALACAAERYPPYVAAIERGAGALMVAALSLIAYSLPFIP